MLTTLRIPVTGAPAWVPNTLASFGSVSLSFGATAIDQVSLCGSNDSTAPIDENVVIGSYLGFGGPSNQDNSGLTAGALGTWKYLAVIHTQGSTAGMTLNITGDDGNGSVETVTATAPITATPGPNVVIGITPATDAAAGSMSASDKTVVDYKTSVTAAALEALPGPMSTDSVVCWVEEFSQNYVFTPGSIATVDHFTVLGETGGVAGRWLLNGSTITLSPLGGVADDAPRIQAAAIALAAYVKGGLLQLSAGTFLVKTVIDLSTASGITVAGMGRHETLMSSSLTPSGPGGFTASVFFANYTNIGVATSLTADAVYESFTLAVGANAIPNKATVLVSDGSGLIQQQFTVLAGGGTGSFTTDDPILFHFTAGMSVTPLTVPADITIRDLRGSGTGDRFFEIARGNRCRVLRIAVTREVGSFSALAGSFDVGGRRNLGEDIVMDCGGVSIGGLALESQVFSVYDQFWVSYTATAIGNTGVVLITSAQCRVSGWAQQCGTGCRLTFSTLTDADACHDNVIEGWYTNSANYGVLVDGGSNNALAVNANANAASGIVVDGSGLGTPSTNLLVTGEANDNGQAGLYVAVGACTVFPTNFVADRNAGGGGNAGGILVNGVGAYVLASGYGSVDSAAPWNVNVAATLIIERAYVKNLSFAGFWAGQVGGANGVVRLSDYVCEFVAGAGVKAIAVVEAAGCELHLARVKTIGVLTDGVAYPNAVAAKLFRYEGVDLSSCTTPYNLTVQTLSNFGTGLVATGAAQIIPAACNASDSLPPVFMCTLSGGTGPSVPTVTAGANQFTVQFASGDRSTYDWKVAA